MPSGSRDVPGVNFGAYFLFFYFLGRHRREKGVPFGFHFGPFAYMVAVCFFVVFLGASLSRILQF